ncbi:hypothetical protein A2U01_0070834, partial [Trifolium medium]|nr:hypothetical protein [Trifolium medium]
MCRKKKILK